MSRKYVLTNREVLNLSKALIGLEWQGRTVDIIRLVDLEFSNKPSLIRMSVFSDSKLNMNDFYVLCQLAEVNEESCEKRTSSYYIPVAKSLFNDLKHAKVGMFKLFYDEEGSGRIGLKDFGEMVLNEI